MKTSTISFNYFNPLSITVLIILFAVSAGLYLLELISVPILVVSLVVSLLIASSIQIADQWEKAVVLRMGRIIDQVNSYIDQRVRVTEFRAEQTLTKDTVPVNVDAIIYWTVWDVEKAALEVQDYVKAISYIAQTDLRDIIGKHELADLLQEREKIAEALQKTLDTNTNPWGITCQTVGIRDAMSKQAQAERERKARVILGTAETEIAEKFAKASEQYINNPVALHLRGMNMLYEGLKEKGSMIIVPSSALDSMNLGVIGGLVSLAKSNESKKD
jgi:regulator of protease activity HflC (stomatin/prohibitin superfamily)